MSGLVEFLLARIADDEAAARAAMPGPWLSGARDGAVASKFSTAEHGSHDASTFAVMLPGPEVWNPATAIANATHMARHDPARVLAECDTKRALVTLVQPDPMGEQLQRLSAANPGIHNLVAPLLAQAEEERKLSLRLLALPYADHPDYREEWKP